MSSGIDSLNSKGEFGDGIKPEEAWATKLLKLPEASQGYLTAFGDLEKLSCSTNLSLLLLLFPSVLYFPEDLGYASSISICLVSPSTVYYS